MRSTEFMSPPSRGFDLLREAALSLARAHPNLAKLVNPRQTHAIAYTDSPLSSAGDAFARGPAVGAVLQDQRAGTGYLSDALEAPGFTLLVFDDDAAFADTLRRGLQQSDTAPPLPWRLLRIGAAGTQADIEDDADRSIAERHGARAGSVYLVRPDGHVAARWHRPRGRHGAPRAATCVCARRRCRRRRRTHERSGETALPDDARDRVYSACAQAITQAGPARESLFLARLALLLLEQVGDEAACRLAITDALHELPQPSLSALPDSQPMQSVQPVQGDPRP